MFGREENVCGKKKKNKQCKIFHHISGRQLQATSSIHMRQLVNTVQQHHARLLPVLGQGSNKKNCNKFRFFQQAFREEMVFKEAVKAGKEGKKLQNFSDAWACTNNRFPRLQ